MTYPNPERGTLDYTDPAFAQLLQCDPTGPCTDEYPCPAHFDVIVSRMGAAAYTADEAVAIFIADASDLILDTTGVRPTGDAYDLVREYWVANPDGGWCEDPDMGQWLSDAVANVESDLYGAGFVTIWDDGCTIGRITGGPWADQ